jgi:hypothetical protein
MNIESQHILEAFRIAPAIVALLIVIFLQYKIIRSKDNFLQTLMGVSKEDSERYGKLITLLEILVSRKNGG